MIVEIHGAGFHNKGAELMLNTVLYELGHRIPDIKFAINPLFGRYDERSKHAMLQIFPPRKKIIHPKYLRSIKLQQLLAPFVPNRYSRLYGVVPINKIDALIDISGFAYSDIWKVNPSRNFSALTKVFKQQGKPIILLPQALGPFKSRDSKAAFKKVIEDSCLVYARDSYSYQQVLDLCGTSNKIHTASDITFFFPRYLKPKTDPRAAKYCCIIPNSRVLDNTEQKNEKDYLNLLGTVVKEINKQSLPIRILVHDTKGADLKIANQLLDLYQGDENQNLDVKIVERNNPIELKQIIGESLMIFGSRYHALISAFSQAVPSICLGWAPKYDLLYQDFSGSEYIINEQTPREEVISKVNELLNIRKNEVYRRQIKDKISGMIKTNEEMWNNVVQTLS